MNEDNTTDLDYPDVEYQVKVAKWVNLLDDDGVWRPRLAWGETRRYYIAAHDVRDVLRRAEAWLKEDEEIVAIKMIGHTLGGRT